MRKNLIIFLILLASVSLDMSFFSKFEFWGWSPALTLVIIIALSSEIDLLLAIIWSLAAGVLFDLFSFEIIGAHAVSFLLTILLVNFISKKLLASPRTSRVLLLGALVFVGSILNELFFRIIFDLYHLSKGDLSLGKLPLIGTDYLSLGIIEVAVLLIFYRPIGAFKRFLIRTKPVNIK